MGRSRKRGNAAVAGAVVAAVMLVITLLALTVVTVAPALSSRPYVPRPVDFELHDRGIGSGHATSARNHRRRAFRSGILRAPKRFNLVGFHWRGAHTAAISVRVRRRGGVWSRWAKLAAEAEDGPDAGSPESRRSRGMVGSTPLWAGEADELQYRLRARSPVRDMALHFVNTKGTATALDRARTSIRRAAQGIVAAVASLAGGSKARADTAQPSIIPRDEWGASSCPPRATPAHGEVKLAFVHHTVTANDYAPEDSAAMVLAICRYHRNSNGWNDIGYQFLVDQYGQIFEGRAGGIDQAIVGAQAQGYNSQSTGIANLGTFSVSGQTEAGLSALARLLSWKLSLHGVDPRGTVVVRSAGGATNRYAAGTAVELNTISGHRDANATACPGDALYAQLPRLRTMVTGDTRPPARLLLTAASRRIPYGRKVRLTGALTASDGMPVAGQPVVLQSLGLVGARTLVTLTTDAQGSFAFAQRLSFNRTLRASFAGTPALRPALSSTLRIGVRPRVTASLSPLPAARLRVGARVLVKGTVQPRKRAGLLLVDRERGDGSFRRFAKKRIRLRRGRALAAYRLSRPGSYRLRLGVDADRHNLGGRSRPLALSAG
jgi:hypothetical protein